MPTVSVALGIVGRSPRERTWTEPAATFDIDDVLNPEIGQVAQRQEPGQSLEVECIVRWNPADKCLPELHIDPTRVAILASHYTRFELRFVRRSDPKQIEQDSIDPLIYVDLNVRGLGFDPSALSRTIGIRASRMRRRDPRSPKRLDSWTWESQRIRSTAYGPLLSDLLRTLSPHAARIRAFCEAHGATATVGLVAEVVDRAPRLVLNAGDFEQIHALGASLWFDPYCRKSLPA